MGKNVATARLLDAESVSRGAAGTESRSPLSTGWINDIYTGHGPLNPDYGRYGTTGGYVPPGGRQTILGPATGVVLP